MIKLIGVYDYTVVLTYLSLISSVFGMTQLGQQEGIERYDVILSDRHRIPR